MKNQKSLLLWQLFARIVQEDLRAVFRVSLENSFNLLVYICNNSFSAWCLWWRMPSNSGLVMGLLYSSKPLQKHKKSSSVIFVSYSNKHELIWLFFIKSKAKTTQRVGNKVFYIAVGVFLRFSAKKFNEEHGLQSNQEKLDTRMLPHLKHAIALILACYSFVISIMFKN